MVDVLIMDQEQLCDCPREQVQDLWGMTGLISRVQSRRRDIIVRLMEDVESDLHIDIGCCEGYITSALNRMFPAVMGFDVIPELLRNGKKNDPGLALCRSSITDLPLPDRSVDSISVLEVLEHLPMNIIRQGIDEIDRVLRDKGCLIVSLPYRQEISYRRCDNCGKWIPDNAAWHLHSFDKERIQRLLPDNYRLDASINAPYFPLITCSRLLSRMPTDLWLPINHLFKVYRSSTWMINKYTKL